MRHDVQQETEIRKYLLGELPFDEQVLVEQRLFLDSEYFDLHQAVEDDLIDQYLADELAVNEREKFENHFLLLPEHSTDLRIAEALQKYIDENRPSIDNGGGSSRQNKSQNLTPFSFFNRRIVWLSAAVATLVLFVLVGWLAYRSTRPPAIDPPFQAHDPLPTPTRPVETPIRVQQNDNTNTTADKRNGSSGSKKPEKSSVLASATASYLLSAGGPVRGPGSVRTVIINPDTKQVIFQLPLEFAESFDKYRAELFHGKRRIKTWPDVSRDKSDSSLVSVQLSADVFREQGYRIKLQGIPNDQQSPEQATEYHFNVVRR